MRRAAFMVLLLGCAPAAPDDPTWLADVRPIVAGNCLRCHGETALGGAPSSFRLDVYETTFRDGMTIRGARAMARFMGYRVAGREDMPPRGTFLSGRQTDIITDWFQNLSDKGSLADNHGPTAALVGSLGAADLTLAIGVEVSDEDRDLVTGTLRSGDVVIGALRDGVQTLVWDTSVLAAGAYPVTAQIDDGAAGTSVNLGSVQVAHASGNSAPVVTLSVLADTIFHQGEQATVDFTLSDADPSDRPNVIFTLVRGATVVGQNAVVANGKATFAVTADPGTSWRLRATASDGKTTRSVESPLVIVTDVTDPPRYDDVKGIIHDSCAPCHDGLMEERDVYKNHFDSYADLDALRGRAWRKVVQLREMPPPSASEVEGWVPLTDANRELLGAWLLAGTDP